ncbi:MAG: hypothetical protein M3R63_26240 [Actinomycetota bacterium]|nr:hypothetical protein [Actinomycetota bacterium]
MDFRWRYQDGSGNDTAGPEITFADQQDAEDWLTREFQALLDAGVDRVVLLDGDDEIYAMSLHPA